MQNCRSLLIGVVLSCSFANMRAYRDLMFEAPSKYSPVHVGNGTDTKIVLISTCIDEMRKGVKDLFATTSLTCDCECAG